LRCLADAQSISTGEERSDFLSKKNASKEILVQGPANIWDRTEAEARGAFHTRKEKQHVVTKGAVLGDWVVTCRLSLSANEQSWDS